jgi:UDP-3-O-[3-hydroxymyristoyl] N-acetylglucosamine deacetylase
VSDERSFTGPVQRRFTLARPVRCSGLGLISGAEVTVALSPADTGITFRRADTGATIPVSPAALTTGPSWTELAADGSSVKLVEHLMATLAASGITDIDVEVDGPELPLDDGSARRWAALLRDAGRTDLGADVPCLAISAPVSVRDAKTAQWLHAFPHDGWRIVYILDWPHPLVDLQTARFDPGAGDFAADIAPARTFALAREAEAARAAGIFAAGDESNVLVIFDDHLSAEPGLPDAFARHKLLDLMGDLYAAGRPWRGLFVAYNSGHRLNHELVRAAAGI